MMGDERQMSCPDISSLVWRDHTPHAIVLAISILPVGLVMIFDSRCFLVNSSSVVIEGVSACERSIFSPHVSPIVGAKSV